MAGFVYQDERLFCEDVDLVQVAEELGTPCFVYSGGLLQEAYRSFRRALGELPGLICYALKANSSMALGKVLSSLGCGADVVSGGELYRALKMGFSPERIVFAGVGKTEEEIRCAIEAKILQLNVESIPELDLVDRIAGELNSQARVALRVNPEVATDTHPHITTANQESKFGLSIGEIRPTFQRAVSLSGVRLTGLHFHLGSQITSVRPYVKALEKVRELIEQLRDDGISLEVLDVGGGLGISYHGEAVPSVQEWLDAMRPALSGSGCRVIIEPGRALVGHAGILMTRVLYVKKTAIKTFLVVDAGMNDLLRPSLYGAYHQIWPLRRRAGSLIRLDVVGPICESTDFLARNREMVLPAPGDLLAVMDTGAYGASMASNYNGRPRAAEALVWGHRFATIRKRESLVDLMDLEVIPDLVQEVGAEAAVAKRGPVS